MAPNGPNVSRLPAGFPGVLFTVQSGETSGSNVETDTLDVYVTPVADSLTLSPTLTFGNEGDDIAIFRKVNDCIAV